MAKRDAIVDCNWSKASIKQMDAAARRYQGFIREHTPWQPFPVTYNTMSCWLADAQFDHCKASTVVTYARNLVRVRYKPPLGLGFLPSATQLRPAPPNRIGVGTCFSSFHASTQWMWRASWNLRTHTPGKQSLHWRV